MTMELLTHTGGDLDHLSERAEAFARIATVDGNTEDWDAQLSALTLAFVDSLLAGDTQALEFAADPLRDRLATLYGEAAERGHGREVRGWFMALLSMCRWGLQRLPAPEELQYQPGTQPYEFLMLLAKDRATTSSTVKQQLNTGDSQVSRTGRDLASSGLVVQRRAGRQALWELTPRGRQAVDRLQQHGHTDTQRQAVTAGETRDSATGRRSKAKTAAARTSDALQRRDANSGRGQRRQRIAGNVSVSDAPAMAAFKDDSGAVRHVVRADTGGWAVKIKPSDARAQTTANTKKEALARARDQLGRSGGVLFEHQTDGSVKPPQRVRAKHD
jgi:DNA-binding MarR family transcriptional regulator